MKIGDEERDIIFRYRIVGYVIFFLDVVLAFLIIAVSWFVQNVPLRKAALIFGITMLAISLVLKLARKW